MHRSFFVWVIVSLVFVGKTHGKELEESFFKGFQSDLSKFVTSDGLVDYISWQEEHAGLDLFIKNLESISETEFNQLDLNSKKAFLINAYNAYTIKLILDNFPLNSIRDIGTPFQSPWKKRFFSILSGKIRTLDQIEHTYLRGKAELFDPRVHAVVNCASISCPVLSKEVYLPESLESQMEVAMQKWMVDPSKNQIAPEYQSIKLSKIFDWYRGDFNGQIPSRNPVRSFLVERFKDKHLAFGFLDKEKFIDYLLQAPIDYLPYNWSLNALSN